MTEMGTVSGHTEELTDTEPSIVVDADVNSSSNSIFNPDVDHLVPEMKARNGNGLATDAFGYVHAHAPTSEVAMVETGSMRDYMALTLEMLDTLKHAGSEWDAVINEALSFLESEERR